MEYQLNFFESTTFDPIKEVARRAQPYWTDSREKIIAEVKSSPSYFTASVREEFCPYGYSGHVGHIDDCPGVEEWEMKPNNINVVYLDAEGHRHREEYKWKDFARAVAELIDEGLFRRY